MAVAAFVPVADGVAALKAILPGARVTSGYRGPDHALSKKNPRSFHAKTRAAVDVAPIPGMTFEQARSKLAQRYVLIEALNETGRGRSKNATGDHWHFVLGEKK
jgi:soluble lytic murein transglycosylase